MGYWNVWAAPGAPVEKFLEKIHAKVSELSAEEPSSTWPGTLQCPGAQLEQKEGLQARVLSLTLGHLSFRISRTPSVPLFPFYLGPTPPASLVLSPSVLD